MLLPKPKDQKIVQVEPKVDAVAEFVPRLITTRELPVLMIDRARRLKSPWWNHQFGVEVLRQAIKEAGYVLSPDVEARLGRPLGKPLRAANSGMHVDLADHSRNRAGLISLTAHTSDRKAKGVFATPSIPYPYQAESAEIMRQHGEGMYDDKLVLPDFYSGKIPAGHTTVFRATDMVAPSLHNYISRSGRHFHVSDIPVNPTLPEPAVQQIQHDVPVQYV